MAEWSSPNSYDERVDNLRHGTGASLGGTGIKLDTTGPDTSVWDDGDEDKIRGEKGRDWYFADLDGQDGDDDDVKGMKSDELIDDLLDLP